MSEASACPCWDDLTLAEHEDLQVASVHGELGAAHAGMALRLADELEREDHRTAARVIRALLEQAFPEVRGGRERHIAIDSVVPETSESAGAAAASPWRGARLTIESQANAPEGESSNVVPAFSLDPEKLTKLRVAAEMCGGQRWEAERSHLDEWSVSAAGATLPMASGLSEERARHIAEADPATVLALLDRIEDLERMAGHVEWYADRLRQRCAALYAVAGRVAEFEAELKDLSRKALKGGERR